jgi:hypothetical protein
MNSFQQETHIPHSTGHKAEHGSDPKETGNEKDSETPKPTEAEGHKTPTI